MKHLHVGVAPKNLKDFMRALPGGESRYVNIDGDGWESWGEPIGTDSNDAETIHVTIPCEAVETDSIIASVKGYLVPMKAETQKNIVACLTDDDDWSTLNGHRVWSFR